MWLNDLEELLPFDQAPAKPESYRIPRGRRYSGRSPLPLTQDGLASAGGALPSAGDGEARGGVGLSSPGAGVAPANGRSTSAGDSFTPVRVSVTPIDRERTRARLRPREKNGIVQPLNRLAFPSRRSGGPLVRAVKASPLPDATSGRLASSRVTQTVSLLRPSHRAHLGEDLGRSRRA